ncbi:MAG: VWA domain-containing protein, partial [Candidatus Dojkabacteria bacterium]|nr:VWA domain-containing protein [Candidatus Dojkabacteria bacterium]
MKSLSRKKSSRREVFALAAFALGITLLLIPASSKRELQDLPKTGSEPRLSIEMTVDKKDVQRDDPADEAQTLNYKVKAKNTSPCVKTSINVALVMDKSGSMLDLLSDAKSAGEIFVKNLDFTKDKASIVTYNENSSVQIPLTNNREELISVINNIQAGGNTNIGGAIASASSELLSDTSEALPIIVIFTDGRANKPVNTNYAKEYALDQAVQAKNQGIRIISIAYGNYADKELMQGIASDTPGSYYFAPTGSEMERIYLAVSENLQGASPDTKVSVDLSQVKDIVDLVNTSQTSSYTDNYLIWNFGTLQCQEAVLAEFSLHVNGNASDLDLIDLIATLENSTNYAKSDFISSNNVVTTVHSPLFNITKTDHKETALPGETLDYKIQIENLGTGNGYGITVTDILPKKYLSVIDSTISENGIINNSNIVWDNDGAKYTLNGSFEPTSSPWDNILNLSFEAAIDSELVPGVYNILNTIELSTDKGYKQTATDETEIPYAPDLEITKSCTPEKYTYPGGEVTYTITVKNTGPLRAQNVLVTDDYDENSIIIATGQGAI